MIAFISRLKPYTAMFAALAVLLMISFPPNSLAIRSRTDYQSYEPEPGPRSMWAVYRHERRFEGSAVSVRYPRCLLTARHVADVLTLHNSPNPNQRSFVYGLNNGSIRQPQPYPETTYWPQLIEAKSVLNPDHFPWADLGVLWMTNRESTAERPRARRADYVLNRIGSGAIADMPVQSPDQWETLSGATLSGNRITAYISGYGAVGTRHVVVPDPPRPNIEFDLDYGYGILRGTATNVVAYHLGPIGGAAFRVTGRNDMQSLTWPVACEGDSGGAFRATYLSGGPTTLDYSTLMGTHVSGYWTRHPVGNQGLRPLCRSTLMSYSAAYNKTAAPDTTGNYQRVDRMIEDLCGANHRAMLRGQGNVTASVSSPSSDPYEDSNALNDSMNCDYGDCEEVVHYGETLVMAASPDSGWTFSHWSDHPDNNVADDGRPLERCVCNGSTNATCTVEASQMGYYSPDISYDNATCVAVFKLDTCGNSAVDAGESCDDGGESSTCNKDCTAKACGDGVINASAGETCDDGNATGGDGCSSSCQLEEYCGNGLVEGEEECDGGVNNGSGHESDSCNADCTLSVCGDGVLNEMASETCDDSNTSSGDGCSAICQEETCGNGVIDPAEVCDAGEEGGPGCTDMCELSYCGDDFINQVAGETCDDGNGISGDGCSAICHTEDDTCGDGNVDAGETCDTGGDTDTCDSDCTSNVCGDGHGNVQTEQCDDNNTTNGDGCSSTCELEEYCGDGATQATEQCDDGNIANDDGCDSMCMDEACGDHVKQTSEECDDGNTTSSDGCSSTCDIEAICGNGEQEPYEGCDDGNTTGGDGCSSTCKAEYCGNGVGDPGEDCDDAGDSGFCNADCTEAACGDGYLNYDAGEQCDDGNTTGGDGCSSTCQAEQICGNGTIEDGEDCDDGNNIPGDGCGFYCNFESGSSSSPS